MYMIQDETGDVGSYHVEFLGNPHSRCWAKTKCVGSYRSIAAKKLMWDIEDLIKQFNSNGGSSQKPHGKGRIEEDGDALIVEGFRFETAASREELGAMFHNLAKATCRQAKLRHTYLLMVTLNVERYIHA
ncbi:unnamed protein product [Lota lota]